MNVTLGLIGTALILWSHVLIGWKKRYSFLIMAAGNAVWIYAVLHRYPVQIDFLISSAVFFLIAVRNWIVWGKELKVPLTLTT